MDLSVLKSENLPEKVVSFIDEKVGFFDQTIKVIKHDVQLYRTDKSSSDHTLYLFLRDKVDACSHLNCISWTERVVNDKVAVVGPLFIRDMPVYNLKVFMNLVPELSSMFFKKAV